MVDPNWKRLYITKPKMKKYLSILTFLGFFASLQAQTNDNFKEFRPGGEKSVRSGMDISPFGWTPYAFLLSEFPYLS